MLVKGLLEGAISKVHINGLFTKEIHVTRGVRQGDPLSPLLFSLTTQPLIEYLEYKLSNGKINGVKILEELTICHQLFVDDVGILSLVMRTASQNSRKPCTCMNWLLVPS